jgi:hypothetical protein
MDIKKNAGEQLNGLERILHQIPGFKGYFSRELRRDSDRLQRDFIVRQLGKVKSGMNQALQAASRGKDFDLLREQDRFVKALDKTIAACRYADQGYSGFFDLLKIREAELDKVYDLDARIVESAVALQEEFKALAAAAPGAPGLEPMHEALERIDGLLEQRTVLLKGYDKGETK